MTATSVSVTDDVVREIGEQVSQTLRKRLPKWGDTAFDLQRGIALYSNRADTFRDLGSVRRNKDGSKNRSDTQISGKSFEALDAGARREEGKEVYTTDELAKRDPDDPLFKRVPELKELAKTNHPQTDIVEIRDDRVSTTYQHKLYKDPKAGVGAFMKDERNDSFVVPHDQYDEYMEVLNEKIEKGGDDADRAIHIKKNLERSKINFNDAHSAYLSTTKRITHDASKRIATNVMSGIVSDVAVFACGGAAWEIRDAYRNPDTTSLLERCKRLIAAIWERIKTTLRDRSLREIGSEIVTGVASALAAPLKMATAAIETIVSVLRRLWMEFVDGRIKSLADLIAASLKALFVLPTSATVALLLEAELSPLMSTIPGGEVLAAVIAAVVAGVMIVIGNRSIDGVVQALFGMFNAATIARRRREEIQRMCEEAIPRLIEDRERLQALVNSHFAEREAMLDATFEDMQSARKDHDFDGFLKSLITLNQAYGKMLPWVSFEEFDEFMLDPSRTLKL